MVLRGGSISWNAGGVLKKNAGDMKGRLMVAAVYLQRQVRESLQVAGPTKTHPEREPSKPGEPPRKRTGTLAANIIYEVDAGRLTAYVGVAKFGKDGKPIRYARALELGYAPRGLEERPYLRPALMSAESKIKEILGA